jgi:hypothetical protein
VALAWKQHRKASNQDKTANGRKLIPELGIKTADDTPVSGIGPKPEVAREEITHCNGRARIVRLSR